MAVLRKTVREAGKEALCLLYRLYQFQEYN